jgi:hypothetical protein
LTLDQARAARSDVLTPHRKHTILSEAWFRLSSGHEDEEKLEIYRLDAEVRALESVPDGTLIYVKPGELLPTESTSLSEIMTIYLDERILTQLQVNPNGVEARFQRGILHLAIVNDIAQRSSLALIKYENETGILPDESELKDSLFGRLLKVLVKQGQARTGARCTPESLMRELIKSPHLFTARLQAIAGLRVKAEDLFEGDDE